MALVTRRLGAPWVRNLITPMVSGIWAGDPECLSIEHAFPVMKEMERDGGSLTRGAIRLMRRKKAEREAAGKPKPTGAVAVLPRWLGELAPPVG